MRKSPIIPYFIAQTKMISAWIRELNMKKQKKKPIFLKKINVDDWQLINI